MIRLKFKSNQEFWRKEYLGLKKNTVRTFNNDKDYGYDEREKMLDQFIGGMLNKLEIEIFNVETHEVFVRLVSDVTCYKNVYIISWY